MLVGGRKRWRVAPEVPRTFVEKIEPIHPLVAQLLYNRGIVDEEAVDAFLHNRFESDNPFSMKDVDRAVSAIRRAIVKGDAIVVYGDYDVDGVTAAAILVQTLRALGAQVSAYIPNRADEGYGLNAEALTTLAGEGARMLITVDCGTRSLDEVALARRLGMTVIITDHHHLGPALPRAEALINPRRTDCCYPFKDLAGAGVAFKLAQALLRANRQVPLPTTQVILEENDLLDLVALGTVADMVPLVGENHVLVAHGLTRINEAYRPGLSALMEMSGVKPGHVTTNSIGFSLAPRLNAAGRISEAITALDLLLSPDMTCALPFAQDLEHLNRERQALTLEVQEHSRAMIEDRSELSPLLFVAAENFPSGVVGLAASRLVDEFYRPAAVISIEGEYSKGSARSIPEFHITEALDATADILVRHGGHAAAAGFTVRTENLPVLEKQLVILAGTRLNGMTLVPLLQVDAELPLASLSWDLYHELECLQPFGYGNPAPVFVSRDVEVLHARAVGNEGRHLKMYVADSRGISWDAIAFRQGDWAGRLPSRIDLAYVLEANEWRGRVSLQLNVKDIHVSGGNGPCASS